MKETNDSINSSDISIKKESFEAQIEEATSTKKGNVLLWAFYDAADTIFAMAVISLTLFQWGELMGMKTGYSFRDAHIIISTFLMVSNIFIALVMPIFGAHSDVVGKRKPLVILFGLITIALIPIISLVNNFLVGLIVFTIANVSYQTANLYYEAMLPYISETKTRARVSAFGVAFGYTGTIISLLLLVILPSIFKDATKVDDVIKGIVLPENIELNWVFYMFIFAAVFYLLMAIPFIFVKEKVVEKEHKEKFGIIFKDSLIVLGKTAKEIFTKNRNMLLFMAGWFLINDAVGTATAILVDYLREGLGFEENRSGMIVFIGIIVGIAILYIMGPIIDKKGPRFGLILTILAWGSGVGVSVLSGFFMTHVYTKYVTIIAGSILLAFGMGAVFIVGRQYTLELCPPNKIGQYMGLKKISGKISSGLSLLAFSGVLRATISMGKTIAYQFALTTIIGFFVLGFIISMFIKNYHPLYIKGFRFPYESGDEKKE